MCWQLTLAVLHSYHAAPCSTDLARIGWELHAIATFAGLAAASRRCSFGGPTNYVGRRGIHRLVIDEDEQARARHILKPVAATVDPTPRSLKGYLMAYSMLRAVRTAEGSTVRMRPPALWSVVVSRWPTLGDHLPRERRALCQAVSRITSPFLATLNQLFSGDEGLTTAQLRWQRSDWQSSPPSQRG